MLVRVSPIEKVTSYQRFEGDEEISYVNIGESVFQIEEQAAACSKEASVAGAG